MTDTFVAVDGRPLEVRKIKGAGGISTLVFLHEGLGCVQMWRDFPDRLCLQTGSPGLVYSRFGYGASSPAPLPWPLDFHTREAVDVLPRVLDAAGIDDCVLVGHSDGASIGLIYAGLVRDPRVRAVVALAPHVLNEPRCRQQIEAAVDAFERGDLGTRLARYHGDNLDCAFRGWSESWLAQGFESWDIRPCLDAICVPVMAIRGADDPYNTAVHIDSIRALSGIPAEVYELANCAHAPQFEQGERVLELATEFILRS